MSLRSEMEEILYCFARESRKNIGKQNLRELITKYIDMIFCRFKIYVKDIWKN